MQHMQDKDFDQLFRNKLADAEMEPSPRLWGDIVKEIEPRKKKALPVYWMAAAVAVIAVSVGLLLPEADTIKLQGQEMASITEPVASADLTASKPIKQTRSEVQAPKSTPLVIAPRLTEADVKKDFAALQPSAPKLRPVNMEPKIEQSLASQIVQEPIVPETEIVIASVDVPDEYNAIAETEATERRGIKNVGDLVNYVVERVDKRERKFLKFVTDEDDNSSLVGINIGILKFNKRSDK